MKKADAALDFPVRLLAEKRTVRLVASARLRPPVLAKLVAPERLAALAEIEGATSGRLLAQARGADALAARELAFGVPQAAFVNAAFAYWRPRALNRFNGPGRGAWYAALAAETCVAEVAFHMARELAAVGDLMATVDYAELFASFAGSFVDLRGLRPRPPCLDPDPARGYPAGNALAERARARALNGVVWPSVRHPGGTCLAALFPHAVQSVAQGRVLRLAWRGKPDPAVSVLAK
jgi:RES domain-containing protein